MTYINSMPDIDIRRLIRALIWPNYTDEELAFLGNWSDGTSENFYLFKYLEDRFPEHIVKEIKLTTPESRIDFIKNTSYDLEEVKKYEAEIYPIRVERKPFTTPQGEIFQDAIFYNAKTNELICDGMKNLSVKSASDFKNFNNGVSIKQENV